MTQPAVEVVDLVMQYGSVTAVNGLSLTVAPGTVTAILGPNGAGKTTTIETCEGFRTPQSGSVRVLGLDPIVDSRTLRPRVGVMLQSGGAWSGVRAHEMLRHIASLHAHPLDVGELIERLGMQAYGRTPFRRLSGGQQQRLSLAMAIVGRPELVFLDEPTAGLDPQARHATWDLIAELRDSGVTTVLTTHFMDEAETLSDHIHIVDAGRLIASGTAAELSESGAKNTVRFAARTGLDVESLMLALPDDTKVDEVSPGSYVIAGHVDPALLATLSAWCAGQGVLTESVLVERQTLEDRFLELTGQGTPMTLDLSPRPGAAAPGAMLRSQTSMELRLLMRNGEQLLLTLVIPLMLLIAGTHSDKIVDLGAGRSIDIVTPGVLALAILSTSFTSLAIATGFERRYGVLKRLGASPLPRSGLMLGKIGAIVLVEAGQLVLLCVVAKLIGWHPHGGVGAFGWLALLAVLGTAAFGSLALLIAGTLRAEATLAVANLVYVLLLVGGGLIVPLSRYGGAQHALKLLPSGALGQGLRDAFHGTSPGILPIVVLVVWAGVAGLLAARTFKWE